MKVHEVNGYPILVNGGQPSLLHPATHEVVHRAEVSELISVAHVLTEVREILERSGNRNDIARLICDEVDNVMEKLVPATPVMDAAG